MKANLKELNKDEEWLKNELIKNNIKSAKDVFMQKLEVMELYIFLNNLDKNNFKQNCLKLFLFAIY